MTDASPRSRRARAHVVVTVLIAALVSIGTGRLASAHTDFESSDPADGAVVDGPLAEVAVNFTNPARPAGDGFQLLDPAGVVRSPTAIDETDGTSFVLTFDPPLEAGTYGVRWSVQAGDAHPIEGSFRFDVVVATTTTTPSTTTPTTTTPSTTTPGTTVPAAATPTVPSTTVAAAGTPPPPTTAPSVGSTSLDEFLTASTAADDAAVVGRIGRIASMLGTIFGVGVLAALIWTTRGRRDELVAHLTWIRLAGLAIFTGGLIEYVALTESDPTSSFGSLLTTKPGAATALKMIGGLAVLLGFHQRAGRIVAPAHSLSAASATELPTGIDGPAGTAPWRDERSDEHRWTPTSTAALGMFGLAVVLVSYWFDGHTVSKGPWAVHALVNLVHLGAAAVWGGGVFAMTTIAWMRRRRSERLGLAAMVVRFSSVATASLVAVIAAGAVMAWMILDAPGDLVGTTWGRVLVAKTAAVAVAAALGGYNHLRLRPALERRPDDPRLAHELRVSLTIESAVFVAIVVLTAILVASAT